MLGSASGTKQHTPAQTELDAEDRREASDGLKSANLVGADRNCPFNHAGNERCNHYGHVSSIQALRSLGSVHLASSRVRAFGLCERTLTRWGGGTFADVYACKNDIEGAGVWAGAEADDAMLGTKFESDL